MRRRVLIRNTWNGVDEDGDGGEEETEGACLDDMIILMRIRRTSKRRVGVVGYLEPFKSRRCCCLER